MLSVPVPPVLKPEALSLKLRDTTVTSVEPFSRNQKVHLEYMLLWTLVKQSQPQQGHQGYKGKHHGVPDKCALPVIKDF